jgi:sugar/nucleoside kinase (ribokinase family)
MPYPPGPILCTGNIVYDVLVRPVDGLPPWGATLWVDSIDAHLGGNGAITAYALGKLGASVRLAGSVGDDEFGHYAVARLQSAGVDTSHVRLLPRVPTATTVGLVHPSSERLFLHVKGASDVTHPDDFHFDGCRYFHFASLFQMARMRAGARSLLQRARQAGLVTSLDTAWDPQGRWMEDFAPLCPLIDLLFLNQQEAGMLAGADLPAAVGHFFRDRGVGLIVLKMAENGCALSTPDQELLVPGFPVHALDATGAGDTFCAGFLTALMRGFSLAEAARFANAVAAHCVQSIGGTEGLAGFEETLAWMNGKRLAS